MEYNFFGPMLLQKSSEIRIKINNEQIKKFYKYMELLIGWNKKVNLTAITDPEEIIVKHFIDSLTIQEHISSEDNVIDIGTGAGFPGIPLKILKPASQITLLDSLNKRIKFLEEVINKLELKDIKGIHGRAEELGRDKRYREKYSVATSRAVASLNGLLEYMSPFVKVGGKLICMKGPKLNEELEGSKKAIKLLGLEVKEIEKINLPGTNMDRNILIIEKIKTIAETYPRRGVNIAKTPL